jgi:hypothetical protein
VLEVEIYMTAFGNTPTKSVCCIDLCLLGQRSASHVTYAVIMSNEGWQQVKVKRYERFESVKVAFETCLLIRVLL